MSDEKIERRIQRKLNRLCNRFGELHYEVVKHTAYKNYNDLDILTKKLLVEQLKNKVVLYTGYMNLEVNVLSKSDNIDKILTILDYLRESENELNLGHQINTNKAYKNRNGNAVLDRGAKWLKLYKIPKGKNDTLLEINLEPNDTNVDAIKWYFENEIVHYAVLMGWRIPWFGSSSDDNDLSLSEFAPTKIKLTLKKDEIGYIKTQLYMIKNSIIIN